MYRREKVKGYEEYEVDTNGIVFSKKGKPLKFSHNHNGYQMINFMVNGIRKGFAIHTLVAKQFIPNSDLNKTQVNHKDGNKDNNNVNNLEWVTPKENTMHAKIVLGFDNSGRNNPNAKKIIGVSKTDDEDVLQFDSMADAARYFSKFASFKIAKHCIWRALKGKRKSYRGYYWKYI